VNPPFALEAAGPGRYRAPTDARYWNQIGPFGGWLAGLAAAALVREAPAGWPLRAITLQFLGRLPPGPIDIEVEGLRLQRRVAGLRATLRAGGDARPAVTADAVFGCASSAAPAAAVPRPALPAASTLPRMAALDPLAAFVSTFDYRVAFGAPFAGGPESRSGGWLRSRLPLPPTPAALLMLADAWFPPRWAALPEPVPVSTVSMQVVVHDGVPGPGAMDGFFAACYEEDARGEGYGLERGELWWPDGRLALTMQQLTWVGEPAARPLEEKR
jgi:acyl-CoA thioesterase